jgi:hypothetical protein
MALKTVVLPDDGKPMMPAFMSLFQSSERVGFEPTWLAPIRFRGGAVMTASVPLLNRTTF